MPFSVQLQDRTTLYLLGVGCVCGLGLDLVGIHSMSLAGSLSSCGMLYHA